MMNTIKVAGLMVCAIAVSQTRTGPQATDAVTPTFEVASIKPNTSGGPGAEMYPGKSEVRIKNYSLKQLIQAAYKVKDYSFAGPPWLDSQRFDIVAKLPPGATADQFPAMMETLLRERFQLVVHRESKVMTALALVVDKNGLRIKPVEAGQGGTSWGRAMVKASKVSMTQLADLLSGVMDRPVKNLTELPGVYDIDLKWMPDDAPSMDAAGGGDRQSPTGRAPATSVFSAVQEIGLRLQTQKLPVEVLVVDHVEKPSAN
ncbi:MAG: TIGR03435 family protein [Bryobacteraceae bacterium]|jgi:uncharacterized protein (TIGR03435 family)